MERERGAGVGTRARCWDMEWKMEEINLVTPQIWGWFVVVCGGLRYFNGPTLKTIFGYSMHQYLGAGTSFPIF